MEIPTRGTLFDASNRNSRAVLRKLLKEIYFYLRIYGKLSIVSSFEYFNKSVDWENKWPRFSLSVSQIITHFH